MEQTLSTSLPPVSYSLVSWRRSLLHALAWFVQPAPPPFLCIHASSPFHLLLVNSQLLFHHSPLFFSSFTLSSLLFSYPLFSSLLFSSNTTAACGCRVAKAGNRSVSSRCGSADVLETLGKYVTSVLWHHKNIIMIYFWIQLWLWLRLNKHIFLLFFSIGVRIEMTPAMVAQSVAECGVGFMYAPMNHPAMKTVAPVRKALGVRTAFNLLGPMTNAASAQHVVIGVFEESLVELMARTLIGTYVQDMYKIYPFLSAFDVLIHALEFKNWCFSRWIFYSMHTSVHVLVHFDVVWAIDIRFAFEVM